MYPYWECIWPGVCGNTTKVHTKSFRTIPIRMRNEKKTHAHEKRKKKWDVIWNIKRTEHLPILRSLREQARRIEDESSLGVGNIRLLGLPKE